MSDDLIIRTDEGAQIDVWNMPWQHLKTAIYDLASRGRIKHVLNKRTFCGEVREVDQPIIKKIVNCFGDKEGRVLAHIATGGFWGEDQKGDIQLSNGMCPHCGKHDVNTQHILWE